MPTDPYAAYTTVNEVALFSLAFSAWVVGGVLYFLSWRHGEEGRGANMPLIGDFAVAFGAALSALGFGWHWFAAQRVPLFTPSELAAATALVSILAYLAVMRKERERVGGAVLLVPVLSLQGFALLKMPLEAPLVVYLIPSTAPVLLCAAVGVAGYAALLLAAASRGAKSLTRRAAQSLPETGDFSRRAPSPLDAAFPTALTLLGVSLAVGVLPVVGAHASPAGFLLSASIWVALVSVVFFLR